MTFGKNWKGYTGGGILILSGLWKIFVGLTEGTDISAGVGEVAAGLGIIGIRGAQGTR